MDKTKGLAKLAFSMKFTYRYHLGIDYMTDMMPFVVALVATNKIRPRVSEATCMQSIDLRYTVPLEVRGFTVHELWR